jgi:hypothetical protein
MARKTDDFTFIIMHTQLYSKTALQTEPSNQRILNQFDSQGTDNKDSKSLSLNPIELISKYHQHTMRSLVCDIIEN